MPGASSTRFPNTPKGYLNAGDPQCAKGGFDGYLGQVAPRFGFAWRLPDTKTVVRGGAGLFWNPQFTTLYNGFVNAAPFSPQVTRFGVRFEDPYEPPATHFPQASRPSCPPGMPCSSRRLARSGPSPETSAPVIWNL